MHTLVMLSDTSVPSISGVHRYSLQQMYQQLDAEQQQAYDQLSHELAELHQMFAACTVQAQESLHKFVAPHTQLHPGSPTGKTVKHHNVTVQCYAQLDTCINSVGRELHSLLQTIAQVHTQLSLLAYIHTNTTTVDTFHPSHYRTQPQAQLFGLHNDVLTHILQYLTCKDLLAVRLTCTHLRHKLYQPLVWQHAHSAHAHRDLQAFCWKLRLNPTSICMTLEVKEFIDKCRGTRSNVPLHQFVIKQLQSVREIHMVDHFDIHELYTFHALVYLLAAYASNVQHIKFRHNVLLSDKYANYIKHLHQLHHLHTVTLPMYVCQVDVVHEDECKVLDVLQHIPRVNVTLVRRNIWSPERLAERERCGSEAVEAEISAEVGKLIKQIQSYSNVQLSSYMVIETYDMQTKHTSVLHQPLTDLLST